MLQEDTQQENTGKSEPAFKIDTAAGSLAQGLLNQGAKADDEESEWSSVEDEIKKVPITEMELGEEGHSGGEILSKHEIKLKPFDKMETEEERHTRLKVRAIQGPLVKVGNINSVVEDRVVINSFDKLILDIDNIVLTKDRLVVGSIEDVFGSIEHPFYSVLLDLYLKSLLDSQKLKIGDPVFCIVSDMKALYEDKIKQLKSKKGCDASNKFDEELYGGNNTEPVDFSDDEKEEEDFSNMRKGDNLGKRKPPGQGKKADMNMEKFDYDNPYGASSDSDEGYQPASKPQGQKTSTFNQPQSKGPSQAFNDPRLNHPRPEIQHHNQPPIRQASAHQPNPQAQQHPSINQTSIHSSFGTQPVQLPQPSFALPYPPTHSSSHQTYIPPVQSHPHFNPHLVHNVEPRIPLDSVLAYQTYLAQVNAMYGLPPAMPTPLNPTLAYFSPHEAHAQHQGFAQQPSFLTNQNQGEHSQNNPQSSTNQNLQKKEEES